MNHMTRTGRQRRSGVENALVVLEVLLAVGALYGSVGLISGNIDIGDAADDLPFGSMAFAGWMLLLVNGVLPAVVAAGALLRRPWAMAGHVVVGVALVGWIVVQVGFLGWPPAVLQVVYFLYGLVILALGVLLWTRARSS